MPEAASEAPVQNPTGRRSYDGLTPLEAALISSYQSGTDRVVEAIESGNSDRKVADQKQDTRHGELMTAIRGVETTVKNPPTGPVSRLLAYLDTMPTLKTAIAVSLAAFVGTTMTAVGGYLTLRLTGSAPTPAQIVSAAVNTPTISTSSTTLNMPNMAAAPAALPASTPATP